MDMDMGDMDMGSMSMGAGSMSMGPGIPSLFYLQQVYWAFVGAVVAAFFVTNVYTKLLCWQRRHSNSATPSRPRSILASSLACVTAVVREASNTSLLRLRFRGRTLPTPKAGPVILVLAYTAVIIVLCFYRLNVSDRWSYEDIGYRTGFITICQLPLLFLLGGKRNIIGYLIGSSYDRINWLHRWASRCLLLTATIHMGYWFADWAPYDYIGTKIKEDYITKHGVIAWAILVWITFSSMTPIRGWSYEFFVIQHIISFVAFIAMIYLHVPPEVRYWIWMCVGLFFFDRFLRACFYMFNNLTWLHKSSGEQSGTKSVIGFKAEFAPVTSDITRITIRNPSISWQPGQHVFLSCHGLAPLQAHPFTVASLPSDGKMEFLVQSRSGGTRRFQKHATRLLPQTNMDHLRGVKTAVIEGPYGHVRDLKQFDSVVLFAGSTGATFTMPLLRDVVRSWDVRRSQSSRFVNPGRVVTRFIKYIWVVKSGAHLALFNTQLSQIIDDVQSLRDNGIDVQVRISVYITCDETFTSGHNISPPTMGGEHGPVKQLTSSAASENAPLLTDDKQNPDKTANYTVVTNKSVSSESSSISDTASTQAPAQSTCCCHAPVSEEAESDAESSTTTRAPCTCGCHPAINSSPRTSTSEKTTVLDSRPLHSQIALYSGRPMIEDLTRAALEQARGETAVLVCGPRSLSDDVREAVVRLSDERAVNKGSGADGIWFHGEAFGY